MFRSYLIQVLSAIIFVVIGIPIIILFKIIPSLLFRFIPFIVFKIILFVLFNVFVSLFIFLSKLKIIDYILHVLTAINRKVQFVTPGKLELLRTRAELYRVPNLEPIISQTFYELSILMESTEPSYHLLARLYTLSETVDENKYPLVWSKLQLGLGIALQQTYSKNITPEIKESILALNRAIEVLERRAMPIEMSVAMMNLANAYRMRPLGDPIQDIEKAIRLYKKSLEITTRKSVPVLWADNMFNLGIAYRNRIHDDRVANVDRAINAYEEALTVRTRDTMRTEWATTMRHLAVAYYYRYKGGRDNNLRKSINICDRILQSIEPKDNLLIWARTHASLADAYSNLSTDRIGNIRKSISLYEKALSVITYNDYPQAWAQTATNQANSYLDLQDGNQAENIEKAIGLYQQVLTIRARETMPLKWANTMRLLGDAYASRLHGISEENILYAISAFHKSLEVFSPEKSPVECRRVARKLASLYSNQQRWFEAVPIYEQALQSSKILYQGANLIDSKTAELLEAGDLLRRCSYTYARCENLSQAVETLEQGRARGLSESLNRDRADLTKLPPDKINLYTQYTNITRYLRDLENQQRAQTISDERDSVTPEDLRKTAVTLRQQLNILTKDIRQIPSYENFLSLPTFEDVQQAVHDDCPLVYLLYTPNGCLALIVTSQDIQSIWLDSLKEEQLIELLNENWFSAYSQSQSDRQSWFNAIDSVTYQLWEPLMQPLIHHLKAHHFNQVILIPTGYLSFLPLQSAWTTDETHSTGRRYALDDIHFTYVPNARSLTAARTIAHRLQPDSILAIDNPRKDLLNSEREINAAVSEFQDHTILQHNQATIEAVKSQLPNTTIAHFSCHGTANLTEPLNSGLLMSDGLLTLKDIFALNLTETGGLRLAILSACGTGLQGIENADEAISLPTGLLQAGVAAVISSLWSVDDRSTMILLTRFYDLWRTEGLEISQALRQAQQWVRDTTNGEKAAYFKDSIPTQSTSKIPASTADHLYKSLVLSDPNTRDFAHPFHWAAFSYTGA